MSGGGGRGMKKIYGSLQLLFFEFGVQRQVLFLDTRISFDTVFHSHAFGGSGVE